MKYFLFNSCQRSHARKRRGPGGPRRFNCVCVCVYVRTKTFHYATNRNKVCFCRPVSTRHLRNCHRNLALLCPDRAANGQTYRPTKHFFDCSVSCQQFCQCMGNAFRSMHQTREVKTRLFNEQTVKLEG